PRRAPRRRRPLARASGRTARTSARGTRPGGPPRTLSSAPPSSAPAQGRATRDQRLTNPGSRIPDPGPRTPDPGSRYDLTLRIRDELVADAAHGEQMPRPSRFLLGVAVLPDDEVVY